MIRANNGKSAFAQLVQQQQANQNQNPVQEMIQTPVQNQRSKFPPIENWMNIGYWTEWTDPETGEVENIFLSTPLGVGLDRQELVPVNGKTEKMRAIQKAKNKLLEQLWQVASNLEPGQEVPLTLSVVLRRVGSPDLSHLDSENSQTLELEGPLVAK